MTEPTGATPAFSHASGQQTDRAPSAGCAMSRTRGNLDWLSASDLNHSLGENWWAISSSIREVHEPNPASPHNSVAAAALDSRERRVMTAMSHSERARKGCPSCQGWRTRKAPPSIPVHSGDQFLGKLSGSHQVTVTLPRDPATFIERPDHQALPTSTVPSCEYARQIRRVAFHFRFHVGTRVAFHA